jgi:hypothetical protein
MHPLVEQCLKEVDAERVLTIIDRFASDPPDTAERLSLAQRLLDRRLFTPAETIFWQIVCMRGASFPASSQVRQIEQALGLFPEDYGVSRRLVRVSRILAALPDSLYDLFRWEDKLSRRLVLPLVSPSLIAPMVQIIEEPKLYPKDSPGRGWAPVHALRILAELEAEESIHAMLCGMLDPEIFDYALKELAFALGRVGGPALRPALKTLETPGLDEFQIITLLRVVRDIGLVDEQARPMASASLVSRAKDELQPPEVRAFCLRYLIEMESSEHFEAVESMLDEPWIARGVALPPSTLRNELRRVRAASERQRRRQAIFNRFQTLYSD